MKINTTFSRDLIKGRIAEVIFEQMIREENRYTVIPFGYEHTMPMLTQYRDCALIPKIIDNISEAPDFVLISDPDKTKVYLVEVKYQTVFDFVLIKQYAEDLTHRWEHPWIFVATPEMFYCGLCKTIYDEDTIKPLSESWVAAERQKAYLELLNEFRR